MKRSVINAQVVKMLVVDIRLLHTIAREAAEGPTHRRSWCGKTAYLCGRRPLGFQCYISLCPTMEKVQPCPQQGQSKSQCPEFLLDIKAQAFWSPCHPLRGLVAASPAWSQAPGWERTHGNAWAQCINTWVRARESEERETASLFLWDYIS